MSATALLRAGSVGASKRSALQVGQAANLLIAAVIAVLLFTGLMAMPWLLLSAAVPCVAAMAVQQAGCAAPIGLELRGVTLKVRGRILTIMEPVRFP